jgi:hypothetical protein
MPHQLVAKKYNENKTLDLYPLSTSPVLPFSEAFSASHVLSLVEKTHKTTIIDPTATTEIPPPMPESLSIAGQSNRREREKSERDKERARDTLPQPPKSCPPCQNL